MNSIFRFGAGSRPGSCRLSRLVGLAVACSSFGSAWSHAQTIPNASFETPTLSANTFVYRPTTAGWTFVNGAGIARNGSGFTAANPNAPAGSQVLFCQGIASAQRLVTIPTAGTFRVRLKAAQRSGNQQSFRVFLDGTLIDVITPSNKFYVEYITSAVALAAGDRMLRIESTSPIGGDHTVLIDDLGIDSVTAAGNWSNPLTWGGTVPAAGSHVEIPEGEIVVLDQDVIADSIVVRGTLRFARKPLNVQACSIIADGPSARIEIGTEQSRYTDNLTITLTGGVCTAPTACTCATTGHEMTDGNVISSINGGVLDIHGTNTLSWTKLNATVNANTPFPVLTLAQPVTWPAGAEILITSSTTDYNETETRTIHSVSANGLEVTLTSPLAYQHIGVQQSHTRATDGRTWNLDLRAEVGLLSRNIKIQGDAASVSTGFGGHVMIMKSGSVLAGATGFVQGGRGYVEGAEFFRMGRKSVMGKYPLHFHMLGEEGKGQYFRNNSIHRSYNRAIVIHGTESSLVERNVCYDHIGHGVMLEDGSERFNRILNNLVTLTRRPATQAEAVTLAEFTGQAVQRQSPASYWITNPNNIVENNVAAGTQGTGMWLLFPRFPVGASASDSRFSAQNPSLEPLGSMKGNISHSSRTGFDVSDGLTAEHDIRQNLGTQYPTGIVLENCTGYANYTGIYTGLTDGSDPSLTTFRGFILADNAHHFMMAQSALTEDSLAVADTGLGLFKFPADGVTPAGVRRAFHRSYDGPARFKNVHLVGFDAADATMFSNNGASFKHTNALFENITFNHAGPPKAHLIDYSNRPYGTGPQHYYNPRIWMMALRDPDGSVGGAANSSIITNHPFMRTGTDYQPANWTNTFRSQHKFAYTTINAGAFYGDYVDATVTRERAGEASESIYYSHFFEVQVELPLIVNEDYFYSYQFHSLPSGKNFYFGIGDVAVNDFVKLRFRNVGNFAGLQLNFHGGTGLPLGLVSSKAAVDSATVSSYFKDTATGDLWVKFFNQSTVAHTTTRFRAYWTGDAATTLLTAVDTDGDGMGDYAEALGTGDFETGVRDPMVSDDLQFTFDTAGSLDGWVPTGISPAPTVAGGELLATSTAGDPYLTRTGFNFKGSDIPAIFVRYRSDATGNLQLFWSNESGGITSARMVNATAGYAAGSGYKIAMFNLANHAEWAGKTIKSLRIDTLGTAGKSTWIDWIKATTGDSDGDGRSDAEELLTGGDATNANDLHYEFNTSADFEGWTTVGLSAASVSGGSLLSTSTAGDPQLIRDGFQFAGADVTSITVRYQSTASGTLQLFWSNEDGGFSSARLLNATPSYTANSGYKIATFNLSGDPDWVGKTIKSLRLDTLAGAGKQTWIDYIRANNAPVVVEGTAVIASVPQSADQMLKPSFAAAKLSANGLTRTALTIDAQQGVTYRLMASPDMSPGSWRLVNSKVAAATGRLELLDDATAPTQFYRVEFANP